VYMHLCCQDQYKGGTTNWVIARTEVHITCNTIPLTTGIVVRGEP
jgi:hypothetical protein